MPKRKCKWVSSYNSTSETSSQHPLKKFMIRKKKRKIKLAHQRQSSHRHAYLLAIFRPYLSSALNLGPRRARAFVFPESSSLPLLLSLSLSLSELDSSLLPPAWAALLALEAVVERGKGLRG
jgi:hypothetical protein